MITADRLREMLSYNSITGIFTRSVSIPGYRAGSVAGSPDKDGYICIQIDGKKYKAHRLAWLYMTGEWPVYPLDHRNGIKSDNSFDNLRDCTMRTNVENKRIARADNALGVLGVSRKGNRFIAQIQVKGEKLSLGSFSTESEASQAYLNAKRRLHGGNTL